MNKPSILSISALLAASMLPAACAVDAVPVAEHTMQAEAALSTPSQQAIALGAIELAVNDHESLRFFVRANDGEPISVTTALVGRTPAKGRPSAAGQALADGHTPLELWLALSDEPAPIELLHHHQQLYADGVVGSPSAPDLGVTSSGDPQASGGNGIDEDIGWAGCGYWAYDVQSDHINPGTWDGSYLSPPDWTMGANLTASLGTTDRWIAGACFVGEYSVEAGTEYYTINDMLVCIDDHSPAAWECVSIGYREWVLWFADLGCNDRRYDLKVDHVGTGSNMYRYAGMWYEDVCRTPDDGPAKSI